MDFDLRKIKKVHFVGIGGIGISAIARMMMMEGKAVSGSDTFLSDIVSELKRSGVEVFEGHSASHLPDNTDVVIYTQAVKNDNPELVEARRRNIPLFSYPQALGAVSENKRTIAISGTHGKTTTTAMVARILKDAGFDPTVVVGSLLMDEKSNFIAGKGEYFIAEACEYKRSFLELRPEIIVITNIEPEHLDYYRGLSDVQEAFLEFSNRLSLEGYLVLNGSQQSVKEIVEKTKAKIFDYGKVREEGIKLSLPGRHNIENAKAALGVAEILGIDRDQVLNSLRSFQGTWRRFEFKGKTDKGAKVYDDYAHHPTEIKASLQGAREIFPGERIIVVFQPHLYSRTKNLLKDFTTSFNLADEVIFLPIYAAREEYNQEISSRELAGETSKVHNQARYMESFGEAAAYLKERVSEKNVIITMGAGNVSKVADLVLKKD